MLVFGERGKPEYPGKSLSEQSREPTNSTHIWRPIRESNPGHIGGRPVLSSLRQHCSHSSPGNHNSKKAGIICSLWSEETVKRECCSSSIAKLRIYAIKPVSEKKLYIFLSRWFFNCLFGCVLASEIGRASCRERV